MKKTKFIIISAIAICAILTSVFVGSQFVQPERGNETPVRIGILTWAGCGPGFVGVEENFFDGLDVEIVLIDDSDARHAAFANGDLDVMITNIDQHAREVLDKKLPGSVLHLSDISYGADGILVRDTIGSIKDLRGKKIAYTRGTTADWLLANALKLENLSFADVNLVEVADVTTAIAAFNSGQVDACVAWEPDMSRAATSHDARVLITSKDIPDSIIGIFVAHTELLRDREAVHAILDGWLQSVEFCRNRPREANMIMARGFGIEVSEVENMMNGLILADRRMNQNYLSVQDDNSYRANALIEEAARAWKALNILSSEIPEQNWISDVSIKYFEGD